jgi:flagella basal body P-ring formation protein FlgA
MRALCLMAMLLPGAAQAQAVIVTHMLTPGSVIGEADVALVDADIPGAVPTLEAALGLAVTETIYPGRPVLLDNLSAPDLVERNQSVSLVYQAGPLQILAKGRALSGGAAGAEVKVMNMNSHATVTGLVGADGTVHVGPPQE